jgi:hypothetical protein
MPVMNSVLASTGDFAELVVANAMVIGVLYVLEKGGAFASRSARRSPTSGST